MTRHSRPQAGRDGAPGHAAGMNEPPFTSFCEAVRALLDESAADKGYHRAGLAGPNPLYAFVAETAGGPGHALGEIIYKVRRYAARRNPEDLVKVAAWAYLVWCFDRPGAGSPDVPVTVSERPSREEP